MSLRLFTAYLLLQARHREGLYRDWSNGAKEERQGTTKDKCLLSILTYK